MWFWLAKRLWLAPALVLGYAVFCLFIVALLNIGVPLWLEAPLSALMFPAQVALFLIAPMLSALGLTTRGWFDVPTTMGVVFAIAFYTVLAWGGLWFMVTLFHRHR